MINELLRQIEHGYDEEGSIFIYVTLYRHWYHFNEDTYSSV